MDCLERSLHRAHYHRQLWRDLTREQDSGLVK